MVNAAKVKQYERQIWGSLYPYLYLLGSSRRTGLAVQDAGVVKMPSFARASSQRANLITAVVVQQASLSNGTT
jgi:hypothetical protein